MAIGHWLKNYLNMENGGTELPEATSADNGKVLGVANGEYALVEGGGNVEWIVKNSSNSEMIHTDGNNIYCQFVSDLSVSSTSSSYTVSYYNATLKNHLAQITNKSATIAKGTAIVQYANGQTTPTVKQFSLPVIVQVFEDGAYNKWTLRMIIEANPFGGDFIANANYKVNFSFIIPII